MHGRVTLAFRSTLSQSLLALYMADDMIPTAHLEIFWGPAVCGAGAPMMTGSGPSAVPLDMSHVPSPLRIAVKVTRVWCAGIGAREAY